MHQEWTVLKNEAQLHDGNKRLIIIADGISV